MKEKHKIKLMVYGVLLVLAALYEVYYYTVGVRELSIHYAYGPYYLHLFLTAPLFYFSLGALAAQWVLQRRWVMLRPPMKTGSMVAAVLFLLFYGAVLLLYTLGASFASAGANIVIYQLCIFLADHPLLFLLAGLLWSIGLHKGALRG